MKTLFSLVIIVSLILSSCASTNSILNDGIYSVKPSEIAIGESLSDETSYAAFKNRKRGNSNERLNYSDEYSYRNRQNCMYQIRWYQGCGCTYNEWLRFSHYAPYNYFYGGFYNNSFFYNGMGMHYPSSSFSMYYGVHPYNSFYTNYWYGYGMYNSSHYYSPYLGTGYYNYQSYYGYGYGGNMNGWSNINNYSTSNVIRGPRGTTASGNYNPTGRSTSNKTIKSSAAPTNTPSRTKMEQNRIVRAVNSNEISTSRTQTTNTTISRTNINSRNEAIQTNTRTINRTDNSNINNSSIRQRNNFERNYPSRNSNIQTTEHNRNNVNYSNQENNRINSGTNIDRRANIQTRESIQSTPTRNNSNFGNSPSSGGSSRSTSGSSNMGSGGRR